MNKQQITGRYQHYMKTVS